MFSLLWNERGTRYRKAWSRQSKIRLYSLSLMTLSTGVGIYGVALMLTNFWIGFFLGLGSVFLFMASAFVAVCSYAGILK